MERLPVDLRPTCMKFGKLFFKGQLFYDLSMMASKFPKIVFFFGDFKILFCTPKLITETLIFP